MVSGASQIVGVRRRGLLETSPRLNDHLLHPFCALIFSRRHHPTVAFSLVRSTNEATAESVVQPDSLGIGIFSGAESKEASKVDPAQID